MKLLIGLICFIIGWIASVITRNIKRRIDNTNSKIKMAEKIIEEENKRKEFLKKYDLNIENNKE